MDGYYDDLAGRVLQKMTGETDQNPIIVKQLSHAIEASEREIKQELQMGQEGKAHAEVPTDGPA